MSEAFGELRLALVDFRARPVQQPLTQRSRGLRALAYLTGAGDAVVIMVATRQDLTIPLRTAQTVIRSSVDHNRKSDLDTAHSTTSAPTNGPKSKALAGPIPHGGCAALDRVSVR